MILNARNVLNWLIADGHIDGFTSRFIENGSKNDWFSGVKVFECWFWIALSIAVLKEVIKCGDGWRYDRVARVDVEY